MYGGPCRRPRSKRKLFRERAVQNKFAPNPGLSAGAQEVEALTDIAFYLDEIELRLATIAMAFNRNKPFNVLRSMQATGLHIATRRQWGR
jgi:hypothetical protein